MKQKRKNLIYKLLTREQLAGARAENRFDGAPIDLADGFIHFSTSEQVSETARKHFGAVDLLILAALDADLMSDDLKWEPSRSGDLFPHLYAALPMASLIWWTVLDRDDAGALRFPDLETGLGPGLSDVPPTRRVPATRWSECPFRFSVEAVDAAALDALVAADVGRASTDQDRTRAARVGLAADGPRLTIDDRDVDERD